MQTLYHYCSNEAFHSIVESRRIWLSSLSLSNDSMEGKLVSEIFLNIAKSDGLDQTTLNSLQHSVDGLELMVDGLGFCLSEEGDLLSQWRGYADNATGVSIGFSKDYLEQLAGVSKSQGKSGFSLQKVEYEPDKQERLIKPTYLKIKELIEDGAFEYRGRSILDQRSEDEIQSDKAKAKKAFYNSSMEILLLLTKLFLLKAPAFSEEREWRLITYFVKTGTDICSFRALNDRMVPFREFDISKLTCDSISEVVLGPKNKTPDYVIESFLKQSGFDDVKLSRSKATYR